MYTRRSGHGGTVDDVNQLVFDGSGSGGGGEEGLVVPLEVEDCLP